jgi:hypothetical protein
MAKLGSAEDIRAKMQATLDAKIANGTIMPDANAASAAASVPAFSAGTVALDNNTGRPVTNFDANADLPQFETGDTIDPNATGALGGDSTEAQAAMEAAQSGNGQRERDPDTGQYKPKEQANKQQPAPQVEVRSQESASAAAEDAAGAMLDAWADAEEIEWEGDGGAKYRVRAPKAQAEQVKRGFMRRSTFDRNVSYLNKYRPTLEPIITSGRMEPILPLLQRAIQDQEFGNFVIDAYNRRIAGQPLTPQQQAAIASAQQQMPAQNAGFDAELDPFMAEALSPFTRQLQETQSRLQRIEAERQAEIQRQQQQMYVQQQQAQAVQQAHMDLASMYPQDFSGDVTKDNAALQPVFQYARESGLIDSFGVRGGVVLAAQRLREERAETYSPAANLINAVDRTTLAAAAAQAGAARSVAGGNSAAPQQRRRPPTPPSPTRPDGSRKTPREFMAETQRYAQAMQQSQG